MATVLPFDYLSSDTLIGWGASGLVFGVNHAMVFKCPFVYEPAPTPTEYQLDHMTSSAESLKNEKAFYELSRSNPHPSLMTAIFILPEGLILPRMAMTLQACLNRPQTSLASSPAVQQRWINQIAEALEWMESLGWAHGDLKPGNLFLDKHDNIVLGDFDCSVRRGTTLLACTERYYKPKADILPLREANAATEQFAFASCIYAIRFGYEPFHDLDIDTCEERILECGMPSASEDLLYGATIQQCWNGSFSSMKELRIHLSGILQE